MSDHLGLFAKANALLRESVAILRQTTDHGELALALRRLAIILSEQSPEEAAACHEESLTLSTMQNDRWSMGHALNWLSILHHREFERNGEPNALERAEKCAQQCLDIYQQLDSPWGIAAAYLNLADVARLRQDYAQCKQYALKGHILFREIGIFWGISISLTLIGDAAYSNGAYLEARQYAAQGLQLSSEYRLPTVNFFSLHHLALVIDILLAENHTESAYEFIGLFYQLRQKVHANPSQRQSHPAFQCLSRLDGNLPSHLAAAVERGRLADADEMVQAIIAEFSQETTSKPLSLLNQQDTLSQRELEVLRLVAEGYSNHEIADRLYVGISTVKKHINHIYDKLDARNRTQAVAVARKRQLLTS